jgi:CO dehydrogenase maturation factor
MVKTTPPGTGSRLLRLDERNPVYAHFQREFDGVRLMVAEPTRRRVAVYHQYREYAREYAVRIKVVGNKVSSDDDLCFLRDEVGADLLTWVRWSPFVRAAEKGRPRPFSELEPHSRKALEDLLAEADRTPRDWEKLYRQAVELHLRNARRGADTATGEDLSDQVDPDFLLHPDLQPS